MVDRILITPTRVAVSRPGYDVKSPPAYTTDYLAVDSSFGMPSRLLMSGVLFGYSIGGFPTVSFPSTYALPPFVLVEEFVSPSTLYNAYQKYTTGTPDIYYSPYAVRSTRSNFKVIETGYNGTSRDNAYYDQPRNWIYFAFPPAA